jgi:type III pantothenate kinase
MNKIQCLDIGNSSTKLGIFQGQELCNFIQFETKELISNPKLLAAEILKNDVNLVYCSVVPHVENSFKKDISSFRQEIFTISPDFCAGIPISYSNKDEIGADRIANSIAAFHLHPLPCVVIDLGTATTFDIISQPNGYEGGIILPGPQGFLDFLESNTALLPKLELNKNHEPQFAYGKSTKEAMLLGVFTGYPKMIKGIVENLKADLMEKYSKEVKFVICGGSSLNLSIEEIVTSENLTLQGLRIAYEVYNKERMS